MSIVKINAITVPEGKGAELEKRFAARMHAVDQAPGFEGFDLLRPTKGEKRYFVVTRWADEASYTAWRDSDPHTRPTTATANGSYHSQMSNASDGADAGRNERDGQPGSQRPVATGAELLEFDVVLGSHPHNAPAS